LVNTNQCLQIKYDPEHPTCLYTLSIFYFISRIEGHINQSKVNLNMWQHVLNTQRHLIPECKIITNSYFWKGGVNLELLNKRLNDHITHLNHTCSYLKIHVILINMNLVSFYGHILILDSALCQQTFMLQFIWYQYKIDFFSGSLVPNKMLSDVSDVRRVKVISPLGHYWTPQGQDWSKHDSAICRQSFKWIWVIWPSSLKKEFSYIHVLLNTC
jgi:hypothetical protein